MAARPKLMFYLQWKFVFLQSLTSTLIPDDMDEWKVTGVLLGKCSSDFKMEHHFLFFSFFSFSALT